MTRSIAALGHLDYHFGERFTPSIMAGYIDTYGQVVLHADSRIPVDVHCMLAPRCLALGIDMNGRLSRALPVELAGHSVMSLSPEDTLLHDLRAWHQGKVVATAVVADVAAFVHRHPTLDWSAVIGRAEA